MELRLNNEEYDLRLNLTPECYSSSSLYLSSLLISIKWSRSVDASKFVKYTLKVEFINKSAKLNLQVKASGSSINSDTNQEIHSQWMLLFSQQRTCQLCVHYTRICIHINRHVYTGAHIYDTHPNTH